MTQRFERLVVRLLLAILYRQVYPDTKQMDEREPTPIQNLMNNARDFIHSLPPFGEEQP